jgi:hypothetical protein
MDGSGQKALRPVVKPACPTVRVKGVEDYHYVAEASGALLAGMKLDSDVKGRARTATGDGPNNKHSRFGTTCESE